MQRREELRAYQIRDNLVQYCLKGGFGREHATFLGCHVLRASIETIASADKRDHRIVFGRIESDMLGS